jgi:hypothetical protein
MFDCKIIADSVHETRLITLEATYPRFIHAEIMTHRDRARNAGSSRAIPWPTMCERIVNDPVVPIYWGKSQKGMQTGEEVDKATILRATHLWLKGRDFMVKIAQEISDLGIHKSLCNRLTEPWMWITVVMTSTDWKNFFDQRCHQDAEIHFQKIAGMMKEAILHSVPKPLNFGDWHLPYMEHDDHEYIYNTYDQKLQIEMAKHVSVARCARVSYVQHGEKRKSVEKDFSLAKDLTRGSGELGHRSPFEHVASASTRNVRSGPFRGWLQFRKEVWPNEGREPDSTPPTQ